MREDWESATALFVPLFFSSYFPSIKLLSNFYQKPMGFSSSNLWWKNSRKNMFGVPSRNIQKCGSKPQPLCYPLVLKNEFTNHFQKKIQFRRSDFCKKWHNHPNFFCDFWKEKKIVCGKGGHEVGKNCEKWIFFPEIIFFWIL